MQTSFFFVFANNKRITKCKNRNNKCSKDGKAEKQDEHAIKTLSQQIENIDQHNNRKHNTQNQANIAKFPISQSLRTPQQDRINNKPNIQQQPIIASAKTNPSPLKQSTNLIFI